MGYAVVHMQKIKSGGVRGIQSHNKREHPPKTNPDIDLNKSAENYDIIYADNYQEKIKNIIRNFATETKTVRKDAVVMCNFIVTSDEHTMKSMTEEQQKDFFNDSVKWFADRYGAETIVNAVVHHDETTPHLHIGIVPIVGERLSAKKLFDRKELTAIQTDFSKQVGETYGLERGKEGSERTHLSEQRFKIETANEELQAIKEKISELEERGQSVLLHVQKLIEEGKKGAEVVKTLNQQEKALNERLGALQTEIKARELTLNEISNIKPTRTFTGAVRGVSVEDIENLKKTAEKGLQAEYEYNKLSSEYKKLQSLVPSLNDKIQIAKDKERLNQLENLVSKLPAEFLQQINKKNRVKQNLKDLEK